MSAEIQPLARGDADARIIRAYQRVALLHELLTRAMNDGPETVTFSDQVIHAMADDCNAAMTALEPLLEWNGAYPTREADGGAA